jgi:sugar lactone lactonase YvrE
MKHALTAALVFALAAATARADTLYVSCSAAPAPICRIAPDGTVSTFVTGVPALGMALDSAGNLYTAGGTAGFVQNSDGTVTPEGGDIFKVTPAGVASTFASGMDSAVDLAFDASGNLYASDETTTIYKIGPAGNVGILTSALVNPFALACDSSGNVYATCYGSIEKVTPGGDASVFAAWPGRPAGGLAFDAGGNLYVADGISGVSKIAPNGIVSAFATGLDGPFALAFGSNGDLYVANNPGDTVSEITPSGTISTFATGLQYPQSIVIQTPEPSSLALLSIGTFALLARRRRR